MDLVYPIYLDISMMTGFLASLEGGVIEQADVESRSSDTEERKRGASARLGVSGVLAGLIGGGADLELAKTVSEGLESHYRSTVRFPTSALFIRLRRLLTDSELLLQLTSVDDLQRLVPGDIVEFRGKALPSPAQQIRRAFGQLLPVLEPLQALTQTQLDEQIARVTVARPGDGLTVLGRPVKLENKNHARDLCRVLQTQKERSSAEAATYRAIGEVIERLFHDDRGGAVLFEADGFKAICRVYSSFARNETLDELLDADWQCLGKVLGVIEAPESYDLLRGSPISYLAENAFSELAASLSNENLKIDITDPLVRGPAIIVAPMAVFA